MGVEVDIASVLQDTMQKVHISRIWRFLKKEPSDM